MTTPLRVLILEDQPDDAELMLYELHLAGFAPEWHRVETEQDYLAHLEPTLDVILSDYSLPQYDGLQALQAVQARHLDIPFILVSGAIGEELAVEAMKQGAADYLLKDRLTRLGSAVTNALRQKELRSEKRQAEAAIRERDARIRAFAEALPDLAIIYDEYGRYIEVLSGQKSLLYEETVKARGRRLHEVLPEATADRFLGKIQATLQTGKTQQFEYDLEILEGRHWFEARIAPMQALSGQRRLVVWLARDVTKRKQAEEERKQLVAQISRQAQELKRIMDAVPEGMLLLDAEGRILQANPAAQKELSVLTRARAGDILTHLGDRPLADLLTSPPTRGLWHEVKAEKQTFEIIARPVERGSKPEHWVLVVKDVTQEHQIQAQLQQQERLAVVGQLAAGIAHDFNNILTNIILYGRMVEMAKDLSENVRKRMAVINQQAWHASALISQILDFSRQAVLERRPLDLLPLLKEQVKLLERTLPEDIGIELSHDQEEYIVHADPTRMHQILTNLAVNARDAMPEGGHLLFKLEQISLQPGQSPLLPELEAGDWIQLTVSDTGLGIPPEVLPHIFEPFYTTKDPGKGTGLGLAQIHGIVAQHGGRIGVESEPGAGTTFTIYLPAVEAHPVEISQRDVAEMPQGQGELVLVVEDEMTLRTTLVDTLQQLNYRVVAAGNGKEALTAMAEQGEQFALVVSDVVMPVMGGIALVHTMRQQDWQIPVILLTGHPMGTELDELSQKRLVTWLTKPTRLERLAQLIEDMLHGS